MNPPQNNNWKIKTAANLILEAKIPMTNGLRPNESGLETVVLNEYLCLDVEYLCLDVELNKMRNNERAFEKEALRNFDQH